jgi:hypothetical protein
MVLSIFNLGCPQRARAHTHTHRRTHHTHTHHTHTTHTHKHKHTLFLSKAAELFALYAISFTAISEKKIEKIEKEKIVEHSYNFVNEIRPVTIMLPSWYIALIRLGMSTYTKFVVVFF